MSDQFTTYSMKIFNELNEAVIKKLSTLESKEIDKTINNLMKIEDTFTEMETKLDKTITSMIISKITKSFIDAIENDFIVDVKSQEIFENMYTTLGHLYKGVE